MLVNGTLRWMRVMAVSAIGIALTPLHADDTVKSAADATTVAQAVTQVYQPHHDDFSRSTSALAAALRADCSSGAGLPAAVSHAAFRNTISSFSIIEVYRFGPQQTENRLNRLFFWPDKRRAGERQLSSLLESDEVLELDADVMARKSVALQGFPALERLLYPLTPPEQSRHAAYCAAAIAIGDNIASMASKMSLEWNDKNGFVVQMTQPASDAALFRSDQEVIQRIITQLSESNDVLLMRKTEPLIGVDASVRSAPFWRSDSTVLNLIGNVEGLRALMLDTDLAKRAQLDSELGFEFRTLRGYLDRLASIAPLAGQDRRPMQEAAELLPAVASVLRTLRSTLLERLAPRLGVRTGFNSSDGD